MSDSFVALALVSHYVRLSLLALGGVLAVAAALDWAARTRRLNPFGGVARFMRTRVDPRLGGIERQVVRAGAPPSSTPWWALLGYVIVAALLIAALDAAMGLVLEVQGAAGRGTVGLLFLLVHWTFAFLRVALLIRVLASWLPRLAHSRWLSWSFGATDWMLRPLRRVVPSLGVIDITPIVAYFALSIAEWLVTSVLFAGIA